MLRVHREALRKSPLLEKGWARTLDRLQSIKNRCDGMCFSGTNEYTASVSSSERPCPARDAREIVSWIQTTLDEETSNLASEMLEQNSGEETDA